MLGVIMLYWRKRDGAFPGFVDNPDLLDRTLNLGELGERLFESYEALAVSGDIPVDRPERWSSRGVFAGMARSCGPTRSR